MARYRELLFSWFVLTLIRSKRYQDGMLHKKWAKVVLLFPRDCIRYVGMPDPLMDMPFLQKSHLLLAELFIGDAVFAVTCFTVEYYLQTYYFSNQ